MCFGVNKFWASLHAYDCRGGANQLKTKVLDQTLNIQGGLFNWTPPKNHKFEPVSKCFQKKLEYPDWPPPKISKCQPVFRKKLKYPDWPPPKIKKS